MKRIDKLIISSFLGPFILTFVVVVFILLTQHMLKYFDDIVGKDLGWDVLAQLLFYFAVFMTPIAIPLAVLLSSLMTFGNLGEHFELTAIKSAGISLLRALFPIFIFVLGLSVVAFYSNNYFVPKAALEAYSLLYDIKQKKPALDLKQGAFYNGIPDFSIKVEKKSDDGKTIEDIIMYDHRNSVGNKKVILADSGLMYTINNDRYLKLELFRGNFYFEDYKETAKSRSDETMARSSFERSEYVLDLSSFGLDRTDKSLFEGNRIMRNMSQLTNDVDSVQRGIYETKLKVFEEPKFTFFYHLRNDTIPLTDDLKAAQEKLNAYKRELEVQDSLAKASRELVKQDSIKTKNNKVEEESKEKTPDVVQKQNKEKQVEPNTVAKVKEGKPTASKESSKTSSETENNKKLLTRESAKVVTPEKQELNVEGANLKELRRKKKALAPVTKDTTTIKPAPKPKKKERSKSNTIVKRNEQNKNKRQRRVPPVPVQTVTPQVKKDINDTLNHEEIVKYVETELSEPSMRTVQTTLNNVRQARAKIQAHNTTLERQVYDQNVFAIQYHKILANSVACIIMFLIGAPLGAIIKRGGLGMPVLLSIIFFIIFYVISMTGEKYAKQDLVDPFVAIWSANFILLPVGLLFLRQARNDARLFEADFYNVVFDKFKQWFSKNKDKKEITSK
ncbi:LptF/LptG family permease [Fulvivirga lutea]|uniref:LptF/LptG family permease n=1 Tax=Fulvivirga lutea TaxID=2810512 RepID=A0A974WI71_9BACT|nr:LptF/LptG family permease [Fulvivirga lutea]QSE96590.1 LptF/LptG family permease [Fulvivirga lutea]